MIYENRKMEELVLEVTGYLHEYNLEEAYIESFRECVPAGMGIPGIKEVLDNHQLRDNLTCFILYRSSLLPESARKQGICLADKIDEVGTVRAADKHGEKEELAWEINGMMRKVAFTNYLEAGYAKAWDDQSDPVRRIYRDIEVKEKRQNIIDCLESALDKGCGDGKRISDIIESLEKSADIVPERSGKGRLII